MKKYSLLVVVFLAFSSFESFGQTYEKIYETSSAEIQDRINQNKIFGVEILSGIQTHHVIGLSGLGDTQKNTLLNTLGNDSSIMSFVLSEDKTSITIDSKATFTKEKFQDIIQPMNVVITGYTAEYSIYEQ